MADDKPERDDSQRSSSSGRGPARSQPARSNHASRDGQRKSYPPRDGDRKPYAPRDGERKSYPPRDGDRKPYAPRDGERKSYPPRDGDRKPYAPRDGDRKPYVSRDGDRKPYQKREHAPRAGAERAPRDPVQDALRSVRPRHDDPFIPDEVTPSDLSSSARNELKTLSKENAEWVARHLAMASSLIEDDPALAHQHALSASRRAGRIGIVRETLAITAYATGDYALALRELRTYRRISGKDDQIALMVDSERGVGRPDRALEVGRAVDRATLPASVRVELAIAMSGARLDLDDPARALTELDIPELDPDRAFEWSPGLFAARAAVLEELGRTEEAAQWQGRAIVAADALYAASGLGDLETIEIEEIFETPQDEAAIAAGEPEAAEPEPFQDPESEPEETDVEAADPEAGTALTPEVAVTKAFTIEDEVDEILAEAGIDDEEEGVDD